MIRRPQRKDKDINMRKFKWVPKRNFFGVCSAHPMENSVVKTCLGKCGRILAIDACKLCCSCKGRTCTICRGYLCNYCGAGTKNKVALIYLQKTDRERGFSGFVRKLAIAPEKPWDVFVFGSKYTDVLHGDFIQNREAIKVSWTEICLWDGCSSKSKERLCSSIIYTRNGYQLVAETTQLGYNKYTLRRKEDGDFEIGAIKEAFSSIGREPTILRFSFYPLLCEQPTICALNLFII